VFLTNQPHYTPIRSHRKRTCEAFWLIPRTRQRAFCGDPATVRRFDPESKTACNLCAHHHQLFLERETLPAVPSQAHATPLPDSPVEHSPA
jgi:hypothetical protein